MDKKDILNTLLQTELKNLDQITYLKEMEQFGVLAPGLAHNLGSSITALKGYAQLIQSEYEGLEEIDLILEETELIESIINNLMVRGRKFWDRKQEAINLNDVLRIVCEFMKSNLFYKHRVKKEIVLDDQLPSVIGIFADFCQIVQYPFQNAIEAMADASVRMLRVQSQFLDDHVRLVLEDTGCGISKDNLNRVFEWGFTTKSADPPDESETPMHLGIGLPLVKMKLEKYGGEIQVIPRDRGVQTEIVVPVDLSSDG